MAEPKDMHQCQITNCGFVYNPQKLHRKIKKPLGTKFDALPKDFKCPVCGASKDKYRPLAGEGSVIEDES